MLRVNFYELHKVEDSKPSFAVIVARYKEKCLFVKHKERKTWEIPGGHREKNEDINTTALRELVEETGAKDFKIMPVCIYSVENEGAKSFGQLFYAEINELDELPDSEIGEIKLFDTIPVNLTYPLIQPYLFNEVIMRIYN
ncbi:NUDIX domain-containing protein [Clostridium perfringens]|nr:NUDIX domain-containing protein [Clostridium perfringens]